MPVAASGGVLEALTRPDSAGGEIGHKHPHVLPGGRAALVTIWSGSLGAAQLGVASLETGEVTPLNLPGTSAQYVPPGFLVYAHQATPLRDELRDYSAPRFSPDGQSVALRGECPSRVDAGRQAGDVPVHPGWSKSPLLGAGGWERGSRATLGHGIRDLGGRLGAGRAHPRLPPELDGKGGKGYLVHEPRRRPHAEAAPDGRELFYRSGNRVIAAAVRTTPTFEVERRDVLFERQYRARVRRASQRRPVPHGSAGRRVR